MPFRINLSVSSGKIAHARLPIGNGLLITKPPDNNLHFSWFSDCGNQARSCDWRPTSET